MKNFKKLVSLVLAVVMVLSMSNVAFAATENAAEADVLYDLGLYKGYSSTEKVLGLEDAADAATAIVLIGRALGWAIDEAATVAFTDVPDWAVPYVAYAAANGITNGISATEFGTAVDGKRMVTWTLRALGYDATEAWESTDTLAATAGIAVPAVDVTRDTVAGVIYDTLDAVPVGGTTTVIEDLIAADETLEATAVAAGLVEATPDVLAVDSVTAANLQSIIVKFNKEVDKDSLSTTTLKVYKNKTEDTSYTKSLADDKMTLTIGLSSTAAQNDTIKVVAEKVKDLAGVEMAKQEISQTVLDTTLPTIVDVVATTSKTIDITFSEPMKLTGSSKVWDEFKIDGVKVYATADITSLKLKNKVTLTLASKLAVGDHTIEISEIDDWAGFELISVAKSVSVIEDTAAPMIDSATISGKGEVTVVFNEPVNETTIALNSADFTVTEAGGSAKQITAITDVNGDDKTFKLTVSNFTPAAIVGVEISYKNVQDKEGNKVTTAQTFSTKAEDDLVKPTVTATVGKNNTIDLVFSEKVDSTSATTSSNYMLRKDDKEVTTTITVTAKAGDTTGTKYVASFNNASSLSGAYVLRINNVKDDTIRANIIAKDTDVSVTLADVDTPSIVTASATKEYKDADSDSKSDSLKIVIPYDEDMDSTTALNLANYVVKFASNADIVASTITDAKAEFGADNKTVVITLPGTEDTTTTIKIGGVTVTEATDAVVVKVLAVKDANGNVLTATDINSPITLTGFDSDGMTLSSVKALTKNTVEVKSTIPFASIDPNGIKFYKTGATDIAQPLVVASVSFSTDMKTATLTLASNLGEDAKYDVDETAGTDVAALTMGVISDTAIKNNLGQNVAKGTLTNSNTFTVGTGTVYALSDKIAPTVSSIKMASDAVTEDDIVITWNEPVTVNGNFAYDIVVKDLTADKVLATTEFTLASAGSTATITVTKNEVDGHKFSIEILNGRFVTDASANVSGVKAATNVQKAADTTDGLVYEQVLPTAVAYHAVNAPTSFKLVNATTITVVFSEKLTASKFVAANANGFAVATAGSLTATTLGTDGKTVTLTGTGFDGTTTVAYTAPGTSADIIDLAGNKLATFGATAVH